MTASPEAAAGSPPPAGGSPAPAAAAAPRVRRAPADLPFAFADAALAEALGAERDEPAWLREDRRAAAEAYAHLPVETSELYKTYVDFRAADLFAARPYTRAATAPATPGEIPDGADGIIELREDAVVRLALAPGLAERGVALETLGAALVRDASGIRDALTGTALPADEKLAWLSRGFWSQGIHLHVPAGVRLEHPIVLRWAAGTPDRALLTRTVIRLDEGAEAALGGARRGARGGRAGHRVRRRRARAAGALRRHDRDRPRRAGGPALRLDPGPPL
jgi:Fe-S cluster assembly scaffold protein SufB